MCDFKKIKLVVLDVDGTLTDGGIYYDSNGNEIKRFDVKDGLGIKVGLAAGLEFAIITGRTSCMVKKRVQELGITYLIEGVEKKYPVMTELLQRANREIDEVFYIGDDLNDLQCVQNAGVSACPSDAADEIKKFSDFISTQKGGHGAVRECIEFCLKKQDKWDDVAKKNYCD